jgi:hypothetical protein
VEPKQKWGWSALKEDAVAADDLVRQSGMDLLTSYDDVNTPTYPKTLRFGAG